MKCEGRQTILTIYCMLIYAQITDIVIRHIYSTYVFLTICDFKHNLSFHFLYLLKLELWLFFKNSLYYISKYHLHIYFHPYLLSFLPNTFLHNN